MVRESASKLRISGTMAAKNIHKQRPFLNYSICVPTLNAGDLWRDWIDAVKIQSTESVRILVVDSSSADHTVELAIRNGFEVEKIPRNTFNHGNTRQLAVNHLKDSDIIVFLTQDAILADREALIRLLSVFEDPQIGVAFGRQLPKLGAESFETHARLFNYPAMNRITSMDDVPNLGIKAAFTSNSFAAYRREALMAVGGFPSNVIVSEDMYVSGKMLLAGWKIAYCAEARVYHSHNYTPLREFRRYFDIGVFYAREKWLLDKLGKPESEGMRFLRSEWSYLVKTAMWRIPESMLRACLKYAGYRFGLMEAYLPLWLKNRMSMQKSYWK